MIKNFIIVFSISFTISCSTSPTVLDKVLNKNIYELISNESKINQTDFNYSGTINYLNC